MKELERRGEGGEDFPSAELLPKWLPEPKLDSSKARRQELLLGPSTHVPVLKDLNQSLLFFQAISTELDQKWSRQHWNQHPYRMLELRVED